MEQAELTLQYRELDRDCALLSYRIHGPNEFEPKLFIPDEEAVAGVRETWRELGRRVEELADPDPVYRLVKRHLSDFLDALDYDIQCAAQAPLQGYTGFPYHFQNVVRCDRRPDEARCTDLTGRIALLEENRDRLLALLPPEEGGSAEALRRVRRTVEADSVRLREFFPSFSIDQHRRLAEAMARFAGLLEGMAAQLDGGEAPEEELPADNLTVTVKMEGEEYRSLLRKRLGVSLDELLVWQKEEVEKTRRDIFGIARNLDIPEVREGGPRTMAEVKDILFRYEGPCESPEEMFRRAEEYLKRTRAIAHEYVRLPEDERCRCVPLPDCYKDSYPWGGYEGGDFRHMPYQGQMFLNQYNYQNINDGWIKLNALHEAYPGHHVQYVRTAMAETPETVKLGAKLVPLLEGTCLRTERAFQFLFAEDPFFPLFVAYRRHHAAVRIRVDIMLFCEGAPLEDAVRLYQEELGFDRGTARAQVQAHQNMPGYFTCYYYGMKKLSAWEKEYGFTKWDYTELLFSAGYIGLETFGDLLRLAPEERERYFHSFPSLLERAERKKLSSPIEDLNAGYAIDHRQAADSRSKLRAAFICVDFPNKRGPDSRHPEPSFYYDLLARDGLEVFREISYGKLRLEVELFDRWFTMPRDDGDYHMERVISPERHRAYMQDAMDVSCGVVDYSQFDILYIVPVHGSAVPFSPTMVGKDRPLSCASGEIGLAVTFGADMYHRKGKLFAHENGHILGLPDLYTYEVTAGAADGFSHCGTWDLMGWIEGLAPDYMAYSKWRLGWIEDDQAACAAEGGEFTLTPVETGEGLKLVMIPLDEYHGYAVEYRKPIGLDEALPEEGLLFYRLDGTVCGGLGCLTIIPPEEEQYLRLDRSAPDGLIRSGQTASRDGVTVTALGGGRVRVTRR